MTNDIATALSRIDRALARIEQAAAVPLSGVLAGNAENDTRYQRMRARTHAALAELDTVIARVAKAERG